MYKMQNGSIWQVKFNKKAELPMGKDPAYWDKLSNLPQRINAGRSVHISILKKPDWMINISLNRLDCVRVCVFMYVAKSNCSWRLTFNWAWVTHGRKAITGSVSFGLSMKVWGFHLVC